MDKKNLPAGTLIYVLKCHMDGDYRIHEVVEGKICGITTRPIFKNGKLTQVVFYKLKSPGVSEWLINKKETKFFYLSKNYAEKKLTSILEEKYGKGCGRKIYDPRSNNGNYIRVKIRS